MVNGELEFRAGKLYDADRVAIFESNAAEPFCLTPGRSWNLRKIGTPSGTSPYGERLVAAQRALGKQGALASARCPSAGYSGANHRRRVAERLTGAQRLRHGNRPGYQPDPRIPPKAEPLTSSQNTMLQNPTIGSGPEDCGDFLFRRTLPTSCDHVGHRTRGEIPRTSSRSAGARHRGSDSQNNGVQRCVSREP